MIKIIKSAWEVQIINISERLAFVTMYTLKLWKLENNFKEILTSLFKAVRMQADGYLGKSGVGWSAGGKKRKTKKTEDQRQQLTGLHSSPQPETGSCETSDLWLLHVEGIPRKKQTKENFMANGALKTCLERTDEAWFTHRWEDGHSRMTRVNQGLHHSSFRFSTSTGKQVAPNIQASEEFPTQKSIPI